MASDRDNERLRILLTRADGWAQCDRHGPEWRSAFRCVAGQVRFLLGEGEAEPEPEPSPRELAIRELEELRTLADSASLSWPSAMPWIVAKIDARLANLREVRP